MPGKPHTNSRRNPNHHPVNERNLPVVMLLNIMITLAQTAGSVLSGSLSLLSGALYNLSNAFATFSCYVAIRAGKKDTPPQRIASLGTAGTLAALFNTVIVTVLSVFLIREAYLRLSNPAPVRALVMIVVGMTGLLAGLFAAWIMKNDIRKSSRMKSAYSHQVINSISSAGLITGGILIYIYRAYWIDPLLTGLIALFMLRSAILVMIRAAGMMNHSVPGRLDLSRMKRDLEQFPDVRHVRHLQAWAHGDRVIHLEAHLEVGRDLKISEIEETRSGMEELLRQDFSIHHITLQFEYGNNHVPKAVQKE